VLTWTNVQTKQQEGLKAHEGGQYQANPFDIFSSFFGTRESDLNGDIGIRAIFFRADQGQQQVRRGPTSVSEFEVHLSDMCVSVPDR
jgi:DnaJ-related protein SCJ1